MALKTFFKKDDKTRFSHVKKFNFEISKRASNSDSAEIFLFQLENEESTLNYDTGSFITEEEKDRKFIFNVEVNSVNIFDTPITGLSFITKHDSLNKANAFSVWVYQDERPLFCLSAVALTSKLKKILILANKHPYSLSLLSMEQYKAKLLVIF